MFVRQNRNRIGILQIILFRFLRILSSQKKNMLRHGRSQHQVILPLLWPAVQTTMSIDQLANTTKVLSRRDQYPASAIHEYSKTRTANMWSRRMKNEHLSSTQRSIISPQKKKKHFDTFRIFTGVSLRVKQMRTLHDFLCSLLMIRLCLQMSLVRLLLARISRQRNLLHQQR